MIIEVNSAEETMLFGERLGRNLKGGEVLELIGDVGAGKTTFVKGLARGMGIEDSVQSPSFTISQQYSAPSGLHLAHYDFYRLAEPGLMADELAETTRDNATVTVIEWADTVESVLPENCYRLTFATVSDEGRTISLPDELGAAQ